MNVLRKLRIAVLLIVLATVAQAAWLARSRATSWESTLQVAVFPLNGDGSAAAADYISRLREDNFVPIRRFLEAEAQRYGVALLRPVDISLGTPIAQLPPAPPARPDAMQVVLYSLQLRFWAWRHDPGHVPRPSVRLFVLFHDPARSAAVPNSHAMQQGMLGVAHVFADPDFAEQNNVVVAHELLHTLGATDKYDPATNRPLYPDGYAAPGRIPLHPQERAELMGGRVPVSEQQAEIPAGLFETVIGPKTAREIKWLRD